MAISKQAASRVDSVTFSLREAIFEGRYHPGSPLRELTLAKELKVSQSTIREALRRLETVGLVLKEANRGTTVTRLSVHEVSERVQLRATLESLAACAAAERMDSENLAELERRLKILERAVATDRYYEASQADLAFHHYVWECSGNQTLCRVLEMVTVPLLAFISILRSQGLQRLDTVLESHAPLIDSLRTRDPEKIATAFRNGASHSYLTFLQEGTERDLASAFGFLGSYPR